MDVLDFWNVLTNPQIWPFFLTFLGGYVMMNVFFGHAKMREKFSEFERILIAFGTGVLFEFFFFLPSTGLVNFWIPFMGENVFMNSAFVFCALSAGALYYALHDKRRKTFIKGTKRILAGLTLPFAAFTVLALLIGETTLAWYPPYVVPLISNIWSSFMGLAIASFSLFLVGTFFLWTYVLKWSFTLKSLKEKLRKAATKRNIVASALMTIIVVAMGLAVVPLDMQYGFFTPRAQTGSPLLSSKMEMSEGFEKVVFINATRGARDNVSVAYRYYVLLNITYNVTVPRLRLLSSVYVDNPSNTSFAIGEGNPSVTPTEDWKKLYVDAPKNVTYQPVSVETPDFETRVTGLILSFGNYSGDESFRVTLTYWQEVDHIDYATMEYGNLTFDDLGNGTWKETHIIKITNNSNDTLYIPALIYDRFIMDYVIRNSTAVYFNSILRQGTQLFWPTRLFIDIWARPQTTSNVTISFLTTRNPE